MIDLGKIIHRVAMECIALRMTQTEWKRYKHDHPKADPKNHQIVPDSRQEAPQDQPTNKVTQDTKEDHKEAPKRKESPTKSKLYVKFKKPEELHQLLSSGHYSVISAGMNGNDPDEVKANHPPEFYEERHEQLRKDLERMNLHYTEAVGHYGGKEKSFMVFHDDDDVGDTKGLGRSWMVRHNKEHDAATQGIIQKLGNKYNQDSVLHGIGGQNTLHFTTGKHAGKECGGKGWEDVSKAKDLYTSVAAGRKHTKFQLNLSSCFEKGFL